MPKNEPFPQPPKVLRVSLTGPESTGKSTLAARLAAHYGTTFAPEFAREYLAGSGPHYTAEDLEEIARGQLAAEAEAEALATRVVFCDSDLLVIKNLGRARLWPLPRVDSAPHRPAAVRPGAAHGRGLALAARPLA